MKTATARISLVLWKSKTLKDGTSPIMLAVRFNGQKLVSTHFSCLERHWDSRNECLKRTFPNHAAINAILNDIKTKAVAAKLNFESKGIIYTPSMIADSLKEEQVKANELEYRTVMERLSKDTRLKYATVISHQTAFNSISNFIGKTDFLVTELTDDIIINWSRDVFSRSGKTGTVLTYLAKIAAVVHHANDCGLCNINLNRSLNWVRNNYKKTVVHKSLDEMQIMMLRQYYLTMDKTNINKFCSAPFALGFYLLGFQMFGLAPIDIALLKTSNIEEVDVSGVIFFKISTRRSKTNVPVEVLLMKEHDNSHLLHVMLESASERNGLVFPILEGCTTDKEIRNRMVTYSNKASKHLKKIAEKLGIPRFTSYSYRHTFASLALKRNMPIDLIASGMGRDVANIGVYLKNLNTTEEKVKLAMF